MTVDRVLLIVLVLGLAVTTFWLVRLTVEQRRTRRSVGEPVYRRLPDGRLAFSWATHTAYHTTRHHTTRLQDRGDNDGISADRR